VHADEPASKSARAVNVQAYMVGSDVVFDQGQYAPHTSAGQRLLAQELVHVMQQSRMTRPSDHVPLTVGAPDDRYEQEASRVATQSLGSRTANAVTRSTPTLQRQEQGATATQPQVNTSAQTTARPRTRHSYTSEITPFHFGEVEKFDLRLHPPDNPGKPCRLDAISKVKLNFDTSDPIPQAQRDPWAKQFASLISRQGSYRYLLMPTRPCDFDLCDKIAVRVRVQTVTSGDYHKINVLKSTEASLRRQVTPVS
jgi:hypothetical protein